jgi:vitamin B12 transporter
VNWSKRLVLSVMFVAVVSANSRAQTTSVVDITGRVIDVQNALVAGAVVRLYSRDQSMQLATTTNEDGTYRFSRIAPGTYLIEVDAPGFAHATLTVLADSSQSSHDLALQPASVKSEVVITAAGTPQTVDEVSKAVTIVGRELIDARDQYSIPDALRTVPGLRIRQQGEPGTISSIRIRGLRNQDTSVLIDGMRMRDAAAPQGDASGILSGLAVTNISRVEVLRGSGSSLYGSNAIGGVVNLVTDEGGGPFHGEILMEGGSLGTFRGRARLSGGAGKDDRLIYSVGVSHFNITSGIDENDRSRNTSGQGRLLFRLSPQTTLSGRIYTGEAFVQLNISPEPLVGMSALGTIVNGIPLASSEVRRYESGVPISDLNIGSATFIPSVDDPDKSQSSNFFAGMLTLAGRINRVASYSVTYQGLITNRTTRDGPGGVSIFEPLTNTQIDDEGRIHTLAARSDLQLGRANLVTLDYEFEHESFRERNLPGDPANNTVVDVAAASHAFYVQDQLRFLNDRLQLSAAFRAQFFSLRQPEFTPQGSAPYQGPFDAPPNAYTGDGSIAYRFSSGTKLRAHVGNGYRSPSLYERFGSYYFFGSFNALGDPRLKPDRSIAFDVGVDQQLAGDRVRASATYFYTRLQEVVGFGVPAQPDPFGRFFSGYINTGGGLARGIELSVSASPTSRIGIDASYTYTNSDERTPVEGVIRSFAIPNHQFSLVATARATRRVDIILTVLATSNYLAPFFSSTDFGEYIYKLDGLARADIGASYTLPLAESKSLRFFGKIDNLFGRDYFEDGFRTPGRVAMGGIAFTF